MRDDLEIRFGKPYRRKDGHLGARVTVPCVSGAWASNYSFDTHGMTSSQVAQRARELRDYHDAKGVRLTEFRGVVQQTEFVISGEVYRIVDCTIFDEGVTLYLDVRRMEQDGALALVPGFPIRRKYGSIDRLPSNAEIVATVRAALPDEADVRERHAEFVDKVRSRLKP